MRYRLFFDEHNDRKGLWRHDDDGWTPIAFYNYKKWKRPLPFDRDLSPEGSMEIMVKNEPHIDYTAEEVLYEYPELFDALMG